MLEYSNMQEAVRYHVSDYNIRDLNGGHDGCEKFAPYSTPIKILQNNTKMVTV